MKLWRLCNVTGVVGCATLFCGIALANSFTIPESLLLGTEFGSKAWGSATVTRQDAPGDAVQFNYSGLTTSGTGMKDDYSVSLAYGQTGGHGNGDFSNFGGYSLWVRNLDDLPISMSLFINTGFTGPSGTPPNNWNNDTFWQSAWREIAGGETVLLHLDFDNAIPWGIADNPSPHTQGVNGTATAINAYDRTEVSAIGFEVLANNNSAASIWVSPTPIPEPASTLVLLGGALTGLALLSRKGHRNS